MRPEVSPAELVARCEVLLAWLAPRVERDRAGRRVASNDNDQPRPSYWWQRENDPA